MTTPSRPSASRAIELVDERRDRLLAQRRRCGRQVDQVAGVRDDGRDAGLVDAPAEGADVRRVERLAAQLAGVLAEDLQRLAAVEHGALDGVRDAAGHGHVSADTHGQGSRSVRLQPDPLGQNIRLMATSFSARAGHMFEETRQPPSRWRTFWPDVSDLAGAREAIRLAVWFAYWLRILGVIATVVTLLAGGDVLTQLQSVLSLRSSGSACNAESSIAAVVGAILVAFGIGAALAQGQLPGVVSPFLLVGMINGVRGTVAFKRLARAETETAATS